MPSAQQSRLLPPGSEGIGRGDEALGRMILGLPPELVRESPARGKYRLLEPVVKLLSEDSPVAATLQGLEGLGVEILACRTCVGHFGLQGGVRAGEISTMPFISDLLLRSEVLIV